MFEGKSNIFISLFLCEAQNVAISESECLTYIPNPFDTVLVPLGVFHYKISQMLNIVIPLTIPKNGKTLKKQK